MSRNSNQLLVRSDKLTAAWPRMTQQEQDYVVAMHLHYEHQFSAYKGRHRPEGIAAGIHDAVDQLVDEHHARDSKAAEVQCRRGCAHCCHVNVDITREEALLLHHAADEAGVVLDPERLRAHVKGDACPFLDASAACSVYEHRPTACRKYFVLSDPALCDMKANGGGQVLNFVTIPAEVVFSAALGVFERGSMPAMLLKHVPGYASKTGEDNP